MSVGLRLQFGATAATFSAVAFSTLLACGPSVVNTNNCGETCPVGCDISSDCTTCIPESAQAGVGTACQSDSDCCTGSCQNDVCIANGLTLGSSGGSGQSTTGSNGGSTGAHSSATSSAGGSTGGNMTCTPANPPTVTSDEQCGLEGVWVCTASGICAPNCNYDPSYCGSTVVCEANGHCNTPTSSSTSGGTTTKPTGSGGGSGSAGNGSGGGTSGGGSTSGGVASSSASSASSASSSSTSGGGSTSGGSTGGNSGCGGKGAEYDNCSKNSDCACPATCVDIPGSGSYCLTPCSSYTACELDEICDTTLSPASCYPNYCEPSVNQAWGACAGANDSAGNETGTCNMFEENSGGAYGICEAGGNVGPYGACAFTGSWSTVPAQQCATGEICVTTPSDSSGLCLQACDPTGSLGAPGCSFSTSCDPISNNDYYIGVCQ